MDNSLLIFLHGSDSSSQTYKAVVLKGLFPGMLVPDFSGPLGMRMAHLEEITHDRPGWTMIGSSLGGLMASLFAARHPDRLRKLVLLAPALNLPEFKRHLPRPIPVPTVLIHGRNDDVVPPDEVHQLARRVFTNLTYLLVDDNHRLHHTADTLDWPQVLG